MEAIVFFIGALLGVKAEWETIQRSLFRQLYPLLKFFKQVQIPF